jgi:hypothetical protein
MKATIKTQCAWRGKVARRELRQLKMVRALILEGKLAMLPLLADIKTSKQCPCYPCCGWKWTKLPLSLILLPVLLPREDHHACFLARDVVSHHQSRFASSCRLVMLVGGRGGISLMVGIHICGLICLNPTHMLSRILENASSCYMWASALASLGALTAAGSDLLVAVPKD